MMQVSHSRIETFVQCAYKFKLRYIDKLETLPDYAPDDPLIIGTALHTGIEEGLDAALKFYENSFPCLNDENINEIIKLFFLLIIFTRNSHDITRVFLD